MLGAYIGVSILKVVPNLWLTAVLGGLAVAAFGALLERLILRKLGWNVLGQVLRDPRLRVHHRRRLPRDLGRRSDPRADAAVPAAAAAGRRFRFPELPAGRRRDRDRHRDRASTS